MNCHREVQLYTLSSLNHGAADGRFPQASRVDTTKFGESYAIVGLHIASTFDLDTGNLGGFFLMVNEDRAALGITGNNKCIAQHIAAVSTAGQISSLSDWLEFGDNGILVPAGCPVSLYCSGYAAVSNTLICVVSLHLAPVAMQ